MWRSWSWKQLRCRAWWVKLPTWSQTYVNVIAVKAGNEESDAVKALVDVLKSDEIAAYINDTYQGAVIPVE